MFQITNSLPWLVIKSYLRKKKLALLDLIVIERKRYLNEYFSLNFHWESFY